MKTKVFWTAVELHALAHETAIGLIEAKIGTAPSVEGNTGFIGPIVEEAMRRVLPAERRRGIKPSLKNVVAKFWEMVPGELKKLQATPAAPVAPTPPPAPVEPPKPKPLDLTEIPAHILFTEALLRILNINRSVTVNIPGIDEIRIESARAQERLQLLELENIELKEAVSKLETQALGFKMDLGKFKPPPPVVFCINTPAETQKFLRTKADEGHLEVDWRFVDTGSSARAFKADYVLMFGAVSHDWQQFVSQAVPKSHQCFIGGNTRHDAAMIQVRDWLK